jgi:hypothetical protein
MRDPNTKPGIRYEGIMTSMEKYGEAVQDRVGILNTKIAIIMLKSNPNICKSDEKEMWNEFVKKASEYVDRKLKYAKGSERERYESIRKVIDSILREEEPLAIESTIEELKQLNEQAAANLHKARQEQYEILHHY